MSNRIHCLSMFYLLAAIVLIAVELSISNLADAQIHAATTYPPNLIWIQVSSPVTSTLNSVAMVASNNGWAVGENGALLHYDGTLWTPFSLSPDITLFSVSMSSANNGWALGVDTTPPTTGVLLRWNGTRWEVMTNPSPPWPVYMTDISVPDDTSAWVTGGIIVCSGGPPCNPVYTLGTISHWDGNSWSNTSIPYIFLSSIAMTSDTDGWAVGTELVPSTNTLRSSIMHWDGSVWTSVAHPLTEFPSSSFQYILEEVSGLNSSDAWSAISNQNALLRWSGVSWIRMESPLGGKPSIAAISTNNAWGVGDEGVIAHWDGNSWTEVSSPITVTLKSVSVVSVVEAWAVGTGGTILHGTTVKVYLPLVMKNGE